jgi:hypothetical protein
VHPFLHRQFYFYIVFFIFLFSFSLKVQAEDDPSQIYSRKNQAIIDELDRMETKISGRKKYPDLDRINSAKVNTQSISASGEQSISAADPSFTRNINNSFNAAENINRYHYSEGTEPEAARGSSESSDKDFDSNSEEPEGFEHLNLRTGMIYDNSVDKGPRMYVETVLPLMQSEDKVDTFFTHDRVTSDSDFNFALSGGLGYRRLLFNNNLMLGVNTFFDYQTEHEHYRTGMGLEVKTKTLEANGNFYFGLSERRQIYDSRRVDIFEKAADGFDAEVGGPVPFIPWIKIFEGYQRYFYDFAKDEGSLKQRAQISLSKFLTFNAQRYKAYDGENNYTLDARFSMAFDSFDMKDLSDALKLSPQPFSGVDLTEHTLDRVERNFNIVLERTENPKNFVLVGNLNNVQLVVRFPGVLCGGCGLDDLNSDGFVQADEGFEIDLLLTNLTAQASTGIAYANATTSTGWSFSVNNDADLADAPPGGTSRTDTNDDLDLKIPAGVPDGTQFSVTMDITADGESATVTFGPFTVGSIFNDQVVGPTAFN